LGEGHPVAVFSLGAPRRMLIRAKRDHADRVAVDLVPGSLLALSHVMQTTHEHGIPKVREAGPRISVVFRARGRWAARPEARVRQPAPVRPATPAGTTAGPRSPAASAARWRGAKRPRRSRCCR